MKPHSISSICAILEVQLTKVLHVQVVKLEAPGLLASPQANGLATKSPAAAAVKAQSSPVAERVKSGTPEPSKKQYQYATKVRVHQGHLDQ